MQSELIKSNSSEFSDSEMMDVVESFIKIMDRFYPESIFVENIQGVNNGFILNNSLSKDECEFLIKNIKYNENVEYKNTENITYRKNLRLQINHKNFALKIFKRIKNFLPSYLKYDEDIYELGSFSKGEWDLSYVNERLRFCKYLNEGLFGAHYDGCFIRNKDERSFLTMMFYLNENYDGGETVFLKSVYDKKVISSIKPKTGMMVFFPQNVYHEGRPVKGEKYILRTDIVYIRSFDREGIHLSELEISNKSEALKYLEFAQELERCGQGGQAVEYYKKAFKLDPYLEKVIR
jgi:hypothetical protein